MSNHRLALASALALIACGAPPAPPKQPAPAPASSAPAPAPAPPLAPASTLEPCDEVACVMVDYRDPCCSKFKKPRGGGSAPGADDVPDRLAPDMIREALHPLRGAIVACGDDSSAGHRVKVRVRVEPDGSSEVSIADTDDARLAECVANAVRKATYPLTLTGGAFTQPYVF